MEHGNADHREILRAQGDIHGTLQRLLQSQDATLKAIEGMRTDFRSMMLEYRKETKEEVKALRERQASDASDLHERVNETDRIARATATQMSAITWGLRGAWGAIAVGVVSGIAAIFIGGS